jgi:hypothetical protein
MVGGLTGLIGGDGTACQLCFVCTMRHSNESGPRLGKVGGRGKQRLSILG